MSASALPQQQSSDMFRVFQGALATPSSSVSNIVLYLELIEDIESQQLHAIAFVNTRGTASASIAEGVAARKRRTGDQSTRASSTHISHNPVEDTRPERSRNQGDRISTTSAGHRPSLTPVVGIGIQVWNRPLPHQKHRAGAGAAMGGSISKMMSKIFGSKEMRLLMLGLDAAGKTTILYKLKLDTDVTTIPTVGFNVETVTYKNTKFNVWDVGGQDKIRPLWRHYFSGTQGLIFVVDSNDRDRMDEARKELERIIQDREMKDALLLVFANKQDVRGSLSPKEVSDELMLDRTAKGHTWKVEPSCATTGEGIFEGLAWLSSNVKLPPK
ncbi:hypothetical protein LTR91_012664 [Friedmanniomyces endolithicus]|uniref:ADP-ribosylation factor 6 n=3 Tax=Dothideomycetidae TaxID=451867 RepID=A0AAN6QQI5_9PEZI|nr:hypothetical protein LTS09_006468 [Friedmanniomyces endolithicus]KAK0280682.1 hypothetical protein LTS00_012925 [Friedmanniomyces endolithicus]KAK0288946.1 hypothetical protein LTR35_003347 [Friedmanniomyces endolithicus]KAK0317454.1 hypothetical protein LTR82_011492 [Friedmanniomyces endolithicus]KAK0356663.1 hypothetical protein LTR94_003517 [Friedmanniomyces endolithicus]